MNDRLASSTFLVLVCALGSGCALFGGSAGSSAPDAEPAKAAAGADKPAPTPSASAAASAPASDEPSEPKTKTVSLKPFGLPLAIEVPKYTGDTSAYTLGKEGGAEVGSALQPPAVHVWKAGPQLQTLAQAKNTLKKVPGCLTHPLVREEADHLMFDCTMKSIPHGYDFVMLKEIGGTVYVCESSMHREQPTGFEAELEACRSLRAE